MGVRRFAFVFALLLAVVPATSASPSPTQRAQTCQTLGFQPTDADRDARAGDVDLRVGVSQEQAVGEFPHVLWTLRLRNRTGQALRLTFPTNQYADLVLRRRGRVFHAWSWGRHFYPAFTYRTLAPHETYVCSLGPDELNVEGPEPGRYEQVAFLNTYGGGEGIRVERRGWFSIH